jgi:hypothetical protein
LTPAASTPSEKGVRRKRREGEIKGIRRPPA